MVFAGFSSRPTFEKNKDSFHAADIPFENQLGANISHWGLHMRKVAMKLASYRIWTVVAAITVGALGGSFGCKTVTADRTTALPSSGDGASVQPGTPDGDATLAELETAAGESLVAYPSTLDRQLLIKLRQNGFTGKIESTLVRRLGRPLNPKLVDLGRNIFFDPILSLHNSNSCGGCHSPTNGMGDTQSVAIGTFSNQIVGPNRKGPRNQRRTPTVSNSVFYRAMMWNGRFNAPSGDPFNNSMGFSFPEPEGSTLFPANDRNFYHLLVAQAFIPATELVEAAGFQFTRGKIAPEFDQFDDRIGTPIPDPNHTGFRNEPIRQAVLKRFNSSVAYRQKFAEIYPLVKSRYSPITFAMIGQAIAEFEFSVTFANAPLDKFAAGNAAAMEPAQKRGAMIFFGKGNCVSCHSTAGKSLEMFSDFKNHAIGVPQLAPPFGKTTNSVVYDGPNRNEDFGLEQVTGNADDRYKFRTSPLRNLHAQPAFFHDGAYTRLEDAVKFHLNVTQEARAYDPANAGVAADLRGPRPSMEPVLAKLAPAMRTPVNLNASEFTDLICFLREGLADARVTPANLCKLIPKTLPSGMRQQTFQGCVR